MKKTIIYLMALICTMILGACRNGNNGGSSNAGVADTSKTKAEAPAERQAETKAETPSETAADTGAATVADEPERGWLEGYKGDVEYHEVKGANVNEGGLKTFTVHTSQELIDAIGSNRRIVVDAAEEELSFDDDINLDDVTLLVIEGKNSDREKNKLAANLVLTSGCNGVIIRNLKFAKGWDNLDITIGSAFDGITFENCEMSKIVVNNSDNLLVRNCTIWHGVVVNKSVSVEFEECKLGPSPCMAETHDVSNVWFRKCEFSSSPGDGECGEEGRFIHDSPVVYYQCRLAVWKDGINLENMKCIECPNCMVNMDDFADCFE